MQQQTNMKRMIRRGNRGFSLLEIMVVIIIIGLMAGVVGVQVMKNLEKARRTTAKQQIAVFKDALKQYKMDTGTYPETLEGLIMQPQDEIKWNGPYLDEDVAAIPMDPWGNPYDYYPNGEFAPFEIISYGADGAEGGENENADVYSWELTEGGSQAN